MLGWRRSERHLARGVQVWRHDRERLRCHCRRVAFPQVHRQRPQRHRSRHSGRDGYGLRSDVYTRRPWGDLIGAPTCPCAQHSGRPLPHDAVPVRRIRSSRAGHSATLAVTLRTRRADPGLWLQVPYQDLTRYGRGQLDTAASRALALQAAEEAPSAAALPSPLPPTPDPSQRRSYSSKMTHRKARGNPSCPFQCRTVPASPSRCHCPAPSDGEP